MIFPDEVSGAKSDRPGLNGAVEYLREKDTLVVWRLDRLGRSLKVLVQKIEGLQRRKIAFRSLHESIDTTSPVGKFQFHVFSALAEFERDLSRQRTMAGLRAAKDRGLSISEICSILSISRSTLYRYVSPDGKIRKK